MSRRGYCLDSIPPRPLPSRLAARHIYVYISAGASFPVFARLFFFTLLPSRRTLMDFRAHVLAFVVVAFFFFFFFGSFIYFFFSIFVRVFGGRRRRAEEPIDR